MTVGLWLLWVIAVSLVYEDGRWRLPYGDDGTPCPWPFDPMFMAGQPIGQYHCGWCGSMVVAAFPHPDYKDL